MWSPASIAASVALLLGLTAPIVAQTQPPAATPDPGSSDRSLEVTFRAEAQVGGIAQANSWWNLSQVFKPEVGFAADRAWGEPWGLAGMQARKRFGASSLSGGVSWLGSSTIGKDVFDSGDTGAVALEEAFLAVHLESATTPWMLDVSGGAQRFSLANGFLLKGGGSNGGERGAGAASPRSAWSEAFVVRVGRGPIAAHGFSLVPDQKDPVNNTRLVGGAVELTGFGVTGGATFIDVPDSTQGYAMAPPAPGGRTRVLLAARKGLRIYGVHAKSESVPAWRALSFKFDYVMERNDHVAGGIDMRAWAWAGLVGYRASQFGWKPLLTYMRMAYSGDDPATPNRLEGFDAMYPDRLTTGYQMGAMSAFLFTNTNNVADRLGVDMRPSRKSRLEAYAWRIQAHQLNSPISFGQGDRIDPTNGVLITGVQAYPLTNDIVVMYTRVFSSRVILSLGASASWPGAGIEQLGQGQARMSYGIAPTLIFRL